MNPEEKIESLRRSFKQIPAKQRWQSLKPVLQKLYIQERFQLDDVMAIMKAEYGFVASRRAYKNHFKEWGFGKNLAFIEDKDGNRCWDLVVRSERNR